MAKFDLKIKASVLRKQGQSIGDIAKLLNVSKSTASIWCSNVKLTKRQEKILRDKAFAAGNKGRLLGVERNRQLKFENIKLCNKWAEETLGELSKREFLVAGSAIYWGEGSKSKGSLSFVNSDPDMVKFVYIWLMTAFSVKKKDFIPRVFINEIHRPRIAKVLKFWSNLLQLPTEQFRKTIFIKTKQKKVYDNYRNYFGMMSLRVRKSTTIKYKILGLINVLKSRSSSGS